MDAFVKDLYQGDLTKQASADLQALYSNLSMGELMELAGVKVAVAGPAAAAAPTGAAAAAAKVTAVAPAKKTTPPEMPSEKAAGVAGLSAAGKSILRGAAKGAVVGGAGGLAAGSVADLSNKDHDGYGKKQGLKKGLLYGAVLGGAAGGAKRLPNGRAAASMEKLNQARFLKMAMHSSADAPDSVRVAAIRLAAPAFMKTARPTMGRSPALGMSDKVPFPGQFDEFDAGEASLAQRGPTLAGPSSKTGVTQNAKLQSPFGRTVAQGKPLAQAGGAATAGGVPHVGATLKGQAPVSLKPLTPGAAMTTGSVGKDLSVGWQAAGKHLAKAPGAFMSRPGQALRMMKAPGLSLASRAGTAARMIAPHAGLIGGGLLAAHALAGRSQNG